MYTSRLWKRNFSDETGWLVPVSGLVGVVLVGLIGLGATYMGPDLQNEITGRDHLASALLSNTIASYNTVI
jgi:hypothetical protein